MSRSFLVALVCVLLITPAFVGAQTPTPGTVLSLSAVPPHPSPNARVTVRAENFVVDLDRSRLSWFVNGALVADGVGKTSVEITVGGVGTLSQISVFAEGPAGEILNGSLSLAPGGVSLLWESDSYVPPFYQGKALHPFGGTLTFVAFPNLIDTAGVRASQTNTVFTWKLNNRVLESASGYGKYTMTLPGSPLGRDELVSVTAQTTDGGVSASKTVRVRPVPAFMEVYESDPLAGIHFERVVGEILTTDKDEAAITAYPFFLSIGGRNKSPASVAWRVGDSAVSNENQENPASITLRPNGGARGSASVGITINNLANILQEVTRTFRVQFE